MPFAAIRASDEDLAHRIDYPVLGTAFADLEVAGGLDAEAWEHRGRHKSGNPGVGVECTEALRVTLQTLSIRWIAVPSLADQGIAQMNEIVTGSDIVFAESSNLVFA